MRTSILARPRSGGHESLRQNHLGPALSALTLREGQVGPASRWAIRSVSVWITPGILQCSFPRLDSLAAEYEGCGRFAIVLLDDCVALTRELLKFFAIHNLYGAARIPDYFLSLQNTGRNCHAGSIRTQHHPEEIMCDRYGSGVDSILSHEQPASQAFLDLVKPIARGRLGYLYCQSCSIAAQNGLKLRCRWQQSPQCVNSYAKSAPRNLHNFSNRAPAQTKHRRHSRCSVIAEQTSFDTFSILHLDYERNHSGIREVCEFHRAMRFVKSQMAGELHRLKMWADRLKFFAGQRQKCFVVDGLALGIGSLNWR
jgi:hypothetical protein